MVCPNNHILHGLFAIAQQEPDRVLFTFVDENGKDSETRSAKQLAERVVRLAQYLRDGCGLQKGDTALLIYPPSMEFLEAYAACLYAGIIAAPVYPPNLARPQNDLARLVKIAESSGAKAMLTNRSYRWATRMSRAKEAIAGGNAHWPNLPWYVTQGLSWFAGKALASNEVGDDDVALLQFTSGSTSVPKGVRLTHNNLLHQLDLNADLLGIREDSRSVMWVPQYHDLGLISGITAVLRGRGSLWFMSPLSFLKRPALWFDVIHRVRATHTASPNFGYELICKKTTPAIREKWDLSCLAIYMNAAEPIVAQTMDQFFADFAVTGLKREAFCPAYGLAEHAVGVTISGNASSNTGSNATGHARIKLDRHTLIDKGFAHISDFGDQEIFGCGTPRADVKVRIVDPDTSLVKPERYSGEIWVQSASVADGYQGFPALTAELFQAKLANEEGDWLRTGDIGFLHQGELFITGRQKDLVIIRGRNMHPEDIEESVRRCHPGIRSGGVVAFSIPGTATEELVVVLEVQDEGKPDLDEIVHSVKRKIGEVWQMQAIVGLLASRSLKKTTSGKIQRQACRAAWLADEFKLLHKHDLPSTTNPLPLTGEASDGAAQTAAAVDLAAHLRDLALEDRVDYLLEVIRRLAYSKLTGDIPNLGPDDFLPDAGLDSLASSELLMALEEQVKRSLPTAFFIEHPTLRGAAQRLLRELEIEYLGQEEDVEVETALPFRPPHRCMAPAATRVGIIGGGVGGLISALELARNGYRHIHIFEAGEQVGGKVSTKQVGAEHIELGQNFFGDSFRVVLDLARELGCELAPQEQIFQLWHEEYGYEEPPVRRSLKTWCQATLKASRHEMNMAQPFPSLFDAQDIPFQEFLQKNKLRGIHPMFYFDWNSMGYGLDTEISASYVLPYISVVGALGNSAYVKDGNQSLWLKLAEHLQQEWGVTISTGQRVDKLHSSANGVTLEVAGAQVAFDEVILALPPRQLQALLPLDDPLQAYLPKFNTYAYAVRSFKAKGLLPEGCLYLQQFAQMQGRTILLQACHQHTGWYICAQYGSDFAKQPEAIAEEVLQAEISELVQKMGGEIEEFGPSMMWDYFPHLRENAAQVLQAIEGKQGQRHLWMTGSWLSFETTEHVARHARHLVRTCFDPAFGGQEMD